MDTAQFSLPRLNNLAPTLESTTLKLMEEAGELAQAIGKFRGLNGEKTTMEESLAMEKVMEELFDVAQTAASMAYQLEDIGMDIDGMMARHIQKLKDRGYLKDEPVTITVDEFDEKYHWTKSELEDFVSRVLFDHSTPVFEPYAFIYQAESRLSKPDLRRYTEVLMNMLGVDFNNTSQAVHVDYYVKLKAIALLLFEQGNSISA